MRVYRTAPCEYCGQSFDSIPSRHRRFCSNACSRHASYPAPLTRFWSNVLCGLTPDACWRWTGTTISSWSPYGRLTWEGRQRLAHHVSYVIHVGPIPDGMVVRHRCPGGGNPWCVHPRHLLLGTKEQNAQDMLADGRHWSQTGRWHPKRIERPDGIPQGHKLLAVFLSSPQYRMLQAQADALGLDLRVYASEILKGAIQGVA